LESQFKSTPKEILKRYEKWKDIVAISGPAGLKLIRGFRDEALSGQRKGSRSSRLGKKYRVIYEVEASRVLVKVIEVTAHDYRKK
jgi:proteic killer suppression protein